MCESKLKKISSKTHSRFDADKFSVRTYRNFSREKYYFTYFEVFSHDEPREEIKKNSKRKTCGFDNETTNFNLREL